MTSLGTGPGEDDTSPSVLRAMGNSLIRRVCVSVGVLMDDGCFGRAGRGAFGGVTSRDGAEIDDLVV